ncbi:MAG: tetratricopeptide repeat protein [Gammaproteobacteria bacterium]|nr:tetratricopeptide repeat protein [Gammaproteobacteria bacterium]
MKQFFIIVSLCFIGIHQAGAQSFDYSADRDPALRVCDELLHSGQRFEANSCYASLLTDSADALIRAEAAWQMGDLQAANAYFRTAVEIDPESPRARTRWARLFLMTHQNSDAIKLFQEALELNSEYLPAKLGLATVATGRFEDRANALVEAVLEADSLQLEAQLLRARMSLEDGSLEAANESLDEALRIAEIKNLPPLEVYALKASFDLLRGVTESEWTQRALDFNPQYGEIFAIPAHFYVITRRYREAIALLFDAVRIQPDLWSAHTELGINLLRQNRVDEAQHHLSLAYRGDPYSAQIVNTLRLIDSLENFQVLHRDLPPLDSDTLLDDRPGMILRLHNDEAPIIEAYVTKLVADSIQAFTKRYQFELREPVVAELYPDHDDFAVRTSGLPGIGLLGVAFGYLVAMDSPSGRGEGEFHWGTTLWHEMAHVFTLEATNHLVPRWFSEGVSVFEEWSTGPRPGRHIPMHVLDAMKEEKLLSILDIDRGFIRPEYQGQIMVSYMQAGLICQYIERDWGQQGLVDLLQLYRDGADTGEAIEEGLGVTPSQFDLGFNSFIESAFRPTLDVLDDWKEQTQLAHEAANEGDWDRVLALSSASIQLYPGYVEEGDVYILNAKAHEELGQAGAAIDRLEEYWRLGGYEPRALHQLADWLYQSNRPDDAIAVLNDVIFSAPLDESLHTKLGDWLLESKKGELALREYSSLLAMKPHDEAAAHYRLATAYRQLENEEKTREHLLYALETAPHYREAQQLLLEILR